MDPQENQPEPQPGSPSPEQNSRPPSAPKRGRTRMPNPSSSSASSESADRLTILAHELGNILDGSLRCLGLAQRALPGESDHEQSATESGSDEADASLSLNQKNDEAKKKLEVVRQSLYRMAEIVDAAMRSTASSLSSCVMMPDTTIELGEAVFHAVDVLTPSASDRHVQIKARVSNGLSGVPAGPLYPVIVNGLSNAIDAVAACKSNNDRMSLGLVEIIAEWTEDGRIQILIRDEGIGLPDQTAETIFQHGFTTKAHNPGVGLAVARAIVDELADSSIRLYNRADRQSAEGPGTVFEVAYRPAARGNNAGAA